MSRALLDVNVLLALLDADHTEHGRAWGWLDAEIGDGWASCAITQNGFVRVISQPRYPSPISPSEAMTLLGRAAADPHHAFWSCEVSLLDPQVLDATRVHGPRQVTDAYLLALAVAHDGRFVTFDHAVTSAAGRRDSGQASRCCRRRPGGVRSGPAPAPRVSRSTRTGQPPPLPPAPPPGPGPPGWPRQRRPARPSRTGASVRTRATAGAAAR